MTSSQRAAELSLSCTPSIKHRLSGLVRLGDRRGPLATALGKVPPPGLVILAIISIQLGAALAVQLFAVLGASGTVFLRVAISAILMLVIMRPALDRTLRANGGILLAYGGTLAAMNWCFYEALARIPLGTAVTIEFLGPLAVAVLTSRRAIDFLWVALALTGVTLLGPEIGRELDPVGLLFAAAAGTGWACFILLSRRVGRIFPGGSGLALGMTVAAVFLLPVGIGQIGPVLVDPLLLLAVSAVALLSTTIPFSAEFEALKRMPPRTYSILVTLEPAVAAMIGALLLGDSLGWGGLGAIACVTLAAIGATLCRRDDS